MNDLRPPAYMVLLKNVVPGSVTISRQEEYFGGQKVSRPRRGFVIVCNKSENSWLVS